MCDETCCEVDSDCTHAKTPLLIVWTIVPVGFVVVVPLVTVVGVSVLPFITSLTIASHATTPWLIRPEKTGYSALTSFARTFPGHRGV